MRGAIGVAGLAATCIVAAIGAACGGNNRPTAHTPQSTAGDRGVLGGAPPVDSPPTGARRGASATPSGTPGRRGTLLILGTSLTAGLGLDPDQSYPALLQQKIDSAGLPFTVENAGLSGETSAGALRRVAWLLRGPVDVFVLETGANDGLRGLDIDSTRSHIVYIIEAVKRSRPGVKICLVQMEAPPNLGPRYTSEFHALYPSVARAEDVILLPFLLRGVAGRPALNQGDGIHPNVRGEQIVAATLWADLAPVLRMSAAGLRGRGAGGM